jgi:aspartate aminotransferase
MLETLAKLPEDPLLGIMAAFRRDQDPRRVDLGVGVYRTEEGETPIPAAVRAAERDLLAAEGTKVYVGAAGNPRFNQAILDLTFGAQSELQQSGRAQALQAPGGCGALRIGAELLRIARRDAVIHVSEPTWANHEPLLGNTGLAIERYPYLDRATGGVRVAQMLEYLETLAPGAVVLLHGCCHNPSGADLAESDWIALAGVLERRGLLPFVDIAYQGLGRGLEADAFGARCLARHVPEMLVAVSCSKNFGLYRERTGGIIVVSGSSERTGTAMSQLQRIARGMYSMPPDHGAELVARVWESPPLRASWQLELEAMRVRIETLRAALVAELRARRSDVEYGFIARQRGMFSLLPLTAAQIAALRESHHVYLSGDGRINVAGISRRNVGYVAESLAAVMS